MQPLSDEAKAAIRDGTLRGVAAFADLYTAGHLVRARVPLDDANPGTVDVDETAAVERTCTLNIAADQPGEPRPLLPLLGGPLAPSGNEARVWVELALPSGAVEVLPQGVFGLRRPQVADGGGGPVVSAVGRDRAQRFVDATLTAPYDVASGTNVATAAQAFLAAGVPGMTYLGFDPASWPYTSTGWHFAEDDNRWQRAGEMAGSVGAEIVVDLAGQVVMRAVPDQATTAAVWTYDEAPGSTMSGVAQALDADASYSHAVVVGQPADGPPVRSDAYDTDPASPTWWLGPFGDRPVRLSSPLVATQTQADAAAAALLLSHRGLLENVTVSSLAVWAHESRDVVMVRRSSIGVDSHQVLSKFAIPLGPGGADLACRARRIA